MQTNDCDDLKINLTDKDDKSIFESIWQNPNMEMMRVVDLPRFDSKALQDCLVQNPHTLPVGQHGNLTGSRTHFVPESMIVV